MAGAQSYDVIRGGGISALNANGGLAGAVTTWVEDDRSQSFAIDDTEPPSGDGFFYLVRAAGDCDLAGSYDGSLPPQAVPRDPGVAASGADCPR